jgi:phage shock protein PspC (stress-responsive transcriptional regulator)
VLAKADRKVLRSSLLTLLLMAIITLTALLIFRVRIATHWKWILGIVLYAIFLWVMPRKESPSEINSGG